MTNHTPKRLIQALIDAGDNQSDIERETGISQATISRILSGDHGDPRSSTVTKLSDYAATRLKRRRLKRTA